MQPLFASSQTGKPYVLYPTHTGYTTIAPQHSTNNHIHRVYHIVFIFEGTGRLQNSSNMIALEPGTVTVINPQADHIFTTGSRRLTFYAFNFYLLPWQGQPTGTKQLPVDRLEQDGETAPLHTLFGFPESKGSVHYDERNRAGILNLVRNFSAQHEAYTADRYMGEDTATGTAWYRYHAFNFLHTLLFSFLIPRPAAPQGTAFQADALLEKIRLYLESNVTGKFSLQALAAATGRNAGYLSGYFSRHAGMTLNTYFNRLKVKRACVLLKTTRKPITDIAYELGFSSSQHLSMRFKEIKKVSPKKFRDTIESY